MENLNLLSSTSRVETPFIKITIGDYTFGVYDKISSNDIDIYGAFKLNKIKYPNYIKKLTIQKINGTVNKYNLTINYPITENDDPNFFEKVFGSVSKTRKIVFSYGDLSLPSFCYRDEEAMITKIKSNIDTKSSVILYTIEAISTGNLLTTGSYTFNKRFAKPSDVIKELLNNDYYGLKEVFYGMRNNELVEREGLIFSGDKKVTIEMKTNISIFEYLSYLVDCMAPYDESESELTKNTVYLLTFSDDVGGIFEGPYFKVIASTKNEKLSTAYEIDVGFPSQNVITDFRVEDDESYALYYDFSSKLNDNFYVQRINDSGKIEEVFAPTISSGNAKKDTDEAEKSWWTKITEYPIKVSITLKGLLRPAILMTHVKLNVLFYGKKHISSGLYIVTKQVDSISEYGFTTTLNLTRIGSINLENVV